MIEPGADGDDIFRRLYPALRRFAAVVAPLEDDPDDLVQEALVRVLARGSLSELDDPGSYLRRTIANLASNRRRRLGRGRSARRRLGAAADGPPSYPSDLSVLDNLSATDRAILFLGDVEGWPLVDVARMLEMSENAVRLRASRARKRLRSHLEAEEEGS